MSMADITAKIAAKALSIPGIKSAPNIPPEQPGAFPFVAIYPAEGNMDVRPHGEFVLVTHTIFVEFHFTRAMILDAIARAYAIYPTVIQFIAGDPTLAVATIVLKGLRYKFGRLEWNTIETIGYRFEIDYSEKIAL